MATVATALAEATPNTAESLRFIKSSKSTDDWKTAVAHLNRIGNESASNISPGDYVSDLLNPEYAVDDFTPTPLGRFSGDLEVLQILVDQVPFSNGYPEVGEHDVTATVYGDGDEPMTVTFSVTVSESDSDNFDVVISIEDEDIGLFWSCALKITSSVINMATLEMSLDSGDKEESARD